MRTYLPTAGAVVAWMVLLLGSISETKAQETSVDPQTAAALQAKLDELITFYNLKGLSASVIIPGKGTWNGASGISHASVPIDTSMVFAIGSITKNLTAAAILLLQQDGLLSISDSLHEYLPAYPNINPDITIRQLLMHTSGIFNYMSHPDWFPTISSKPREALSFDYVLTNFISPPGFVPGAKHEYSNTNYLLAGLIIEAVTGKSYASFVRERLLDPLQLTSFYVAEHEPAKGLKPHNWAAQAPSDPGVDVHTNAMTSIWGTSAADGALIGNARDLARWGKLLFDGQVLHDSSLQMMTDFMPISLANLTGYGLGLTRFGAGATQMWGHGGNIMGFAACETFSPADSIVVSILSNKDANACHFAGLLLTAARHFLPSAAPEDANDIRDAIACYPNPVRRSGSVRYTLKHAQQVEITLRNSLGETVQTLLSSPQSSGDHSLSVAIETLPSGVYYCTLKTASGTLVQRWVVAPQ